MPNNNRKGTPFIEKHKDLLVLTLSGLILFGSGVLVGMGVERGRGSEIKFERWDTDQTLGVEDQVTVEQPARRSLGAGGSDSETIGRININTASSETLEVLSGIGPAKARAIIDYRSQYGPFSSIEEITKVKGIGPKTFERIKDYITAAEAE